MSKRRLVVTGKGGFVGTALSKAASDAWSDTFDLIDFADPETGKSPDLRDPPALERAIAHAKPDALIHLAAVAAPRQAKEEPATAWQVNVMGTFHLAQSVLRHAPEARFIFAGSSEAYGATFNESSTPLSENAVLQPWSAYGATKAASDIMLRQMAKDGLRATIFRPFNHTGAGQSPTYVVPAFATQIARIEAGLQEPVLKVGNLEAKRDFLDVQDVVDAYLMAADCDELMDGLTLNLSTGSPVAISTLLTMLTDMATVPITVEVDPDRYLPNTIPIMSGNNAKAREALHWAPNVSLSQTLARTLDQARADLNNSSQ
nr:epimerase [Pseudorhizobium flavum]